MKLDNLLSRSISVPSQSCRSIPISCCTTSCPTDQVVLINGGSTPQEVLILRGAYEIETMIAMLNASDAFSVRIGIEW